MSEYLNITQNMGRDANSFNQNYARSLADASVTKRNISWIEENGVCLVNIRPGKSTIRQAGYGAFAQRTLLKGEMIVPAPLLNIMDRNSMLMYELEYDDSK